jgi:single-strand DNA-binding protein
MASYNKVILVGNLTRDPELRYTPKGTALAKIGMAINRVYKTDTGESKEEVTFVDVDAWGRSAETISQYMKKGSPILIEGRLKLDQWDDKQTGQKRSKLGVVVEGFQFLGGPRTEGGGGENRRAAAAAPAAAASPSPETAPAAEPDAAPPEEDDVPF